VTQCKFWIKIIGSEIYGMGVLGLSIYRLL
jgi:hypothetical protein